MKHIRMSKIKTFLTLLVLVISGFLVYSNILNAPFIFDDEWGIVENPRIRVLSNFFIDVFGARGVGYLSFALNYYFGGLNTFGYHIVNVIIHILNAILVYVLVSLALKQLRVKGHGSRVKEVAQSMTHDNIIAFSCSLIFLVHPIQTQAVTYIIQRLASLATFFYLLALVLYIKYRLWAMGDRQWEKPIAYCLSLISAVLAMKTKEISFTLPFIIILYEFTFFKRFERLELFKLFLYLIPYLLTLLIIPLTIALPGSLDEAMHNIQRHEKIVTSGYEYLLTQFSVIVAYIRLMFFPINLHFAYDYPVSRSIFEFRTFISFIFLLSILCFARILQVRSRKAGNGYGALAAFGIFWFFITLSVESSIIPIRDVIFEHRLYLPSIGFIISMVAAGYYLFDRIESKTIKRVLILLLFAAVSALSFAAYKRNSMYNDKLAMLLNEVKYTPNRWSIHNELGREYLNKNMLDEAERTFKKAIEINPVVTAISHRNLGIVYERKGLFYEAEAEYLTSIRLAKYGGGNTLAGEAYINLGWLYEEKMGLIGRAISEYKNSLSLNPTSSLYNYLADIYVEKNMLDDAVIAYKEAIRLNPENADAYNGLGVVYEGKGLFDEAIKMYDNAIRFAPQDAVPYFNKAVIMEKKGDIKMALDGYETALNIDPNLKEAREALNRLKSGEDRQPSLSTFP